MSMSYSPRCEICWESVRFTFSSYRESYTYTYLSLRPWIEIQSLLKSTPTFLLTSRHPWTHPGSSAGLHPPEEEPQAAAPLPCPMSPSAGEGTPGGLNQSSALLLSPPSSSHSFKGIREWRLCLLTFLFFSTCTFYTFFSFLSPFSKKKKPFQVTAI